MALIAAEGASPGSCLLLLCQGLLRQNGRQLHSLGDYVLIPQEPHGCPDRQSLIANVCLDSTTGAHTSDVCALGQASMFISQVYFFCPLYLLQRLPSVLWVTREVSREHLPH